jgi:hypothetical protein
MSVFALVGSLSFAPACTLVVGDAPHNPDDAGFDASSEGELDAAEADDGAALDAESTEDAGSPPIDASVGSAPEASLLDASVVNDDASANDGAVVDAAASGDCGNGGVLWYPDGDDDGYGRSAESTKKCAKPSGAWVAHGGDCKDNDGNVHPEQALYFGEPFTGADGNPSFDYDCSNSEDGNPHQSSLADGCDGILDILNCTGTGYMRQARTGVGVNAVCGSKKVGTCTPMLLSCTTAMETVSAPYQCK